MVGYAIPMIGGGGSLPVYAGAQRQMGGNLFSTLKRFAMPLLKKLLPHLFKAGQSVARVGSGIVGDLVSGEAKNIGRNFKRRGREEINKLSREYLDQDIIQSGEGKRRRVKSINKIQKVNKKFKEGKQGAREISINKKKKRRKLDSVTYLGVKQNEYKQH